MNHKGCDGIKVAVVVKTSGNKRYVETELIAPVSYIQKSVNVKIFRTVVTSTPVHSSACEEPLSGAHQHIM